jgi:DNA-binding response OmpR family regulator
VAKPFNARELVARIKAVLRRAPAPERSLTAGRAPMDIGNIRIDQDRREVTIAGKQVELRAKEFELLVAFGQHMGLVLERDKLLNIVWGYEYFGDTRTVDVHVAHLRNRLEGSDMNIQTIRGVGYKAVLESSQ